ncbi:alpha/beta fold hydrolase [Streptomyces chiangmaiensis]|uniref:Alpha/beta fold hydrolase n=1 Tax=Streptomyces chiangmaiensis TaxID=766497 RepID=A0ABU7FUA8_9ACTN|nr:alpha/beta fold hydrolase [Streptomyces chiangmaiensis]MED7827654.1 alpha/beta fold hydrolase [Streptomyces chiangmaiensis]
MSTEARNVVLVHGGFVDGSGWKGVYDLLSADGYTVTVVQNPTLSLDGDVAATKLVLDTQDGPTVLVGHSYGGAVISEAGNHEKVSALVYIAAFAPDKDESVNSLIADPPPGAPVPPILPPRRASSSWTGRSSPPPSPPTCPPTRRGSSPTPKCRGARTRWARPSPVRPGVPSRASTWSPPRTA